MRIGILSDTHDHAKRTARAVARLKAEGAEVLVHCGDITGAAVVQECAGLTCHYVLGNNDFDEAGLRRAIAQVGGVCHGEGAILDLGGRLVAVSHGHLGKVVRRLAEAEPDYLLFGHSHVPEDRRLGATRWINPGALHRAEAWTVALLDTEADALHPFVIE